MREINFNLNNKKGFTLIEVVAVALLIAMAFLGIYNLFSGGMKFWKTGTTQINAQQNTRLAMDRMARDIRHAGYGVTTGDKITFTSASEIKFRADLNSDGTAEEIHYYLNAGVIYKSIDGSGIPITNNEYSITNLIFGYILDADTDNVGLIVITIDVDRDKNGTADFSLSTEIKPRNL